jgi:CHAT domain-containing protein/tetratricopeptide (TPR) repeat protein
MPAGRKLAYGVALAFLIGPNASPGQAWDTPEQPRCWDSLVDAAERSRSQEQPAALNTALDLYRGALQCDPASLPELRKAEILGRLGSIYLLLQKNQEALDSLTAAVETFAQIENRSGDPISNDLLRKNASTLRNEGLALRGLQRTEAAIGAFNQARLKFQAAGDKPGEVRVLEDLGLLNFLMGENQIALDDYRQALALNQNDVIQKAAILDYVGRVYLRMNDLDVAKSYFQESLALVKNAPYHRNTAYTLNDIGRLWLQHNQPKPSARYHERARALLERYDPANSDGMAESQSYLADAQRASGQYRLAIHNYEGALSLQRRSGDVIGQAQTLVSLAMAAVSVNSAELALKSLAEARDLYHQTQERVGEANARFQMARIYAGQGNDAAAEEQAARAILLSEEVRGFTSGASLRTTYFATLESMYRFQIDLLLGRKPASPSNQVHAFDLVQRAQSRTLLDALETRMSGANVLCAGELSPARDQVLKELGYQNRRVELARSSSNEAVMREAFLAIKRAEGSLDEIDGQCRIGQPRSALLSPAGTSLTEIQEQILDSQSALVQLYLSNPRSYAWVITRSAVRLQRLPAKDMLEQRVRRVLAFGDAATWTPSQRGALQELNRSLAPVFKVNSIDTTSVKRWIIVPDGALHFFPFALLFTEGIPEAEIVKIPSASAVQAMRKTASQRTPTSGLALVADPVFDAEDSRVKSGSRALDSTRRQLSAPTRALQNSHSYSRLPYSRLEAQSITALLPPNSSRTFFGFEASLDAIGGDALATFKGIHIATHAIVDNRRPDLSGIVLSLVSRNGHSRPGYLFLKDIYRMKLGSDLVVLSSCRGALGNLGAGEGPMSLSRAFLFAGSRSVLAGLWEVDDEATALVMRTFYRHMFKENLPPSQACSRLSLSSAAIASTDFAILIIGLDSNCMATGGHNFDETFWAQETLSLKAKERS